MPRPPLSLWRGTQRCSAYADAARLGGESVCGAWRVHVYSADTAHGRAKPLTCTLARCPAHAVDQPYIVMMRAMILKIYLITVVMVNKIVVMVVPDALVKKLTGITKTSR